MDEGAGFEETVEDQDRNKSLTGKGLKFIRIAIMIVLIGNCIGLAISLFFHTIGVVLPLVSLIFLVPLFFISGLMFLADIAFIVLYSIGLYNMHKGKKILDADHERNMKFGITSIVIWPLVTMILPFFFGFFVSLLFIPLLFLPFGYSIFIGTFSIVYGILGFIAALTFTICICVPVWNLTSGDTRKNVSMLAAFLLIYPMISIIFSMIQQIPVFGMIPLLAVPLYLITDALALVSIILLYRVFKSYMKIEDELRDPEWKPDMHERVEVYRDLDLKLGKAIKLPRPNITKFMMIGCILSLLFGLEAGVFAIMGPFGGGLGSDMLDLSSLKFGDGGDDEGEIGNISSGDWEVVSESYSNSGNVQEGESHDYNMEFNGYLSNLRVVLTWEDEADSLRWINNPDEFQLDLRVYSDETDAEDMISDTGENSQGGIGEVVCDFVNHDVENVPYNRCIVMVTLVNAGDYDKRLGIGIIGSRDDSNDYELSVEVEYYAPVEVD